MAGLTQAEQQATLDARFPTTAATDHVAYSINGTSEWAGMARTAIGATGWAAATAATPSVKANGNALTSAAATAASGSVSLYWAVYSASTAGTQRTDWQALTDNAGSARTFNLAIGDTVSHGVGKIAITLD